MSANGLFRRDVVDVGAGDAETVGGGGATADAGTGRRDGGEVGGEGAVAEIEDTVGRYGVAEALV